MSVKEMSVRELRKVLKNYDQDLIVAYRCCSENCLLEEDDLEVKSLVVPRADGWVANSRPDKEHKDYLVFPGN